ncbi:hypothetical protein [Pelagerythrobacter marensis]|uniref:TonB-dependent receptor-like protein n=1 Tax=Pelagerythrobacter marensis TaxID=543877 RepID=A0A0G3X6C7_9SPHN|nr:hypothetical protein [Pelagerythrobacter marensis]AKM06171.1 TonB-dependent receptor-like protein [Pelagerythrobacter marensis]
MKRPAAPPNPGGTTGAGVRGAGAVVRYGGGLAVALAIILPLHPASATATARDRDSASSASAAPDETGDRAGRDADIVVTAPRYGEAEVAAETEIAEDEIASHGAGTISELLERLGPLIDPSGEEPVILVNGKDVGFDRSILAYPPEALQRMGVLEPNAAARYGHPAGKRVVNLVLKKRFASRNAELAARTPTRGGRHGGDLGVGQVAISGPTRWNVQGRVSYDSALRESARDVQRGTVDLVGYIAALDGGEIDPALSAIAGEIVTVAPPPDPSDTGQPALADFAGVRDPASVVEAARFASLLPAQRTLSLNLGASRRLGAFNASVNLTATASDSTDRRGLPHISAVLPAANRWSPFAGDVALVRPLAGDTALRNENDTRSLSISATLSGRIVGWRTNVSAVYGHNRGRNLREHGVDLEQVQSGLDDDAGFNPYRPWSRSLLSATRSRSDSDNLSVRLNAAKPLFELAAAPVNATLTLDAMNSQSRFTPLDRLGNAQPGGTRTTYRRGGGELALSIPLARRDETGLLPLGDLSLDLAAGGQASSGSALRRQYSAGFTWSPVAFVRLRGNFEHRETAPSNDDLGAPRVETVKRVYDFVRQEIAEPIWITGGNPALDRGSQRALSLSAQLRPPDSRAITVDIRYRRNEGRGGIAPFPELTPVTEAAFPERITRDGAGRLVAVDARSINIARSSQAELVSGISLRLPDPAGASGLRATPGRDPLRYTLSVNHTWKLESELLVHSGAPLIDRLAETGQPRHALSARATIGRKALGANLQATWSSRSRVKASAAASAGSDFLYRPPVTVDLGLFVEPGALSSNPDDAGWLANLRLSLDVDNLFDSYRRVTLSDGSVPPGFARYEVDPLGRLVKLAVRKRF